MKKSKKLFSLILMTSLLVISIIPAEAAEMLSPNVTPLNIELAKKISSEDEQKVMKEIQSQLEQSYDDFYDMENYKIDFLNPRVINGKSYIDINLGVNITLKKDINENPYYLGMLYELEAVEDKTQKVNIQKEVDRLLADIALYYDNTEKATATYTIEISGTTARNAESSITKNISEGKFSLYARTDISEEEVVLTAIEDVLSETKNLESNSFEHGKDAVQEIIKNIDSGEISLKATRATPYLKRLTARDYALNYGTSTPEFYGSGNSDCANFVSKALNYGGIPVDKAGNFYPASTYGNTGTCGTNWMRTGYYGNGGVTTYLVGKGWAYWTTNKSSAFAGSIYYYNGSSHVALVTYGDGVTVRITDHSNVTKPASSVNRIVQGTEANCKYVIPYYYTNN